MRRPSRLAIGVAVAWTCAAAAAYWYFFGRDDTDDYAGWLIVVYALQLPVYLAVVTAPRGRELGTGRALAVALPAGLVTGDALMWAALVIGLTLWPDTDFELRPLLIGLVTGVVGVVTSAVGFVLVLRGRPHPRGYAAVLAIVTAAGAASVLFMFLVLSSLLGDVPGSWILILAPLEFVVPLWMVVRSHPAEPPPVPAARALGS